MGIEISDMEVCKDNDLDPRLAGTKEINDVMSDKAYKANVEGLVATGVPIGKARADSGRVRKQVKEDTQRLLELRGLA